MQKEEILENLNLTEFYQEHIPSLQVNGKAEAIGLCCFHDDTNPSLSVNLQTGLYRCFACDAKGDVFTFYQKTKDVDFSTALRELAAIAGVSDVIPQVVATFNYTDADGSALYRKKRIEPGRNGRSKEFIFEHLENGKWMLGRGGEPVLYRLLELVLSNCVFIVEGEAKADLLASWGLTATCLDSGANSKLSDELIDILSKKEKVAVLPDNDKPGNGYALKFANALHDKVSELKIVELPNLPEAGDIIDWSRVQGNDENKLLELVKNATAWTPEDVEVVAAKQVEGDGVAYRFNVTDLGNAKRFISRYKNKIRYCFAFKKWFVFNGKHWKLDDTGEILRLAKDTVKAIYKEGCGITDDDVRKAVGKWAITSESENHLTSMVSLARSEPGIPVTPKELDANHWFLNCQNGTLDLRTGELLKHDPAMLITKILPVEYNPEAQCQKWIEFLEDIFNWDQDLIRFIQRAIGYSLTGDVLEQCLFILYGNGANGKSTFIAIIMLLWGDLAQTADFSSFTIKKGEGVRNDLARMAGKRFISAIESEGEKRLSEVITKQITGGDTITARYLFAEYFEFQPTFKIWLATNHKPQIRGTDYAIWRRIRLIPFDKTFPPDKQDKQLLQKLRRELPGILAWAVQGCLEWQSEGLQPPEIVTAATEKYRSEMDILGAFLEECCILTPEIKAKAGDLYSAYKKWCEETGEHLLTQRMFGLKLSEKGFRNVKSSGNFWKGLGIKIAI